MYFVMPVFAIVFLILILVMAFSWYSLAKEVLEYGLHGKIDCFLFTIVLLCGLLSVLMSVFVYIGMLKYFFYLGG